MVNRSLNHSILEAQAVESLGVPDRPSLFSDFQVRQTYIRKP